MLSEPVKAAAHEAAQKYAQNKCLTLVSSVRVEDDGDSASSSFKRDGSLPGAQKQEEGSESDGGDDSIFDETTDFGIDKNIARAALTALGPEGMFFASGEAAKASKPGTRKKKALEEMDEDERLLASEDAKKLTPRQRRQLRNRVSARHFRLRRKEYISHLESLVVNLTAKINRLDKALKESQDSNENLASSIGPDQSYPSLDTTTTLPSNANSVTAVFSSSEVAQGVSATEASSPAVFATNFSVTTQQYYGRTMQREQYSHQGSIAPLPPHVNIPSPEEVPGQPVPLMSASVASQGQVAFQQHLTPSPPSMSPPTNNLHDQMHQPSSKAFKNGKLTTQREAAESIRMKTNVANLLPVYPDITPMPATTQSFMPSNFGVEPAFYPYNDGGLDMQMDFQNYSQVPLDNSQVWGLDNGGSDGVIRVPNAQIYKSIVPSLEQQLAKSGFNADKPDEVSSDSESENVDDVPSLTGEKEDESRPALQARDSVLSNLAADAILKSLDFQKSRLNV